MYTQIRERNIFLWLDEFNDNNNKNINDNDNNNNNDIDEKSTTHQQCLLFYIFIN